MATFDEPLTPESQAVLDQIFKKYGFKPRSTAQNVLEAGGAAAAGAADAMAANRSAGVQAAIDQERLNEARKQANLERQATEEGINQTRQDSFFDKLIAREQDRRAGGRDAYLNTMRAAYARNPNMPKDSPYQPTRSAEQLRAAELLQGESMRRLEAGDSLVPAPTDPGRFQFGADPEAFRFDPALLRASGAEKALGWGSVAGQVAGQVPGSAWKRIGKGLLKGLDLIFVVLLIAAI